MSKEIDRASDHEMLIREQQIKAITDRPRGVSAFFVNVAESQSQKAAVLHPLVALCALTAKRYPNLKANIIGACEVANKTILKWAGSKVRIMEQLRPHLPKAKRLVEPFAGSCAVMMNTDYEQYLIADANIDLIRLYKQVKADDFGFVPSLIDFLFKEMMKHYFINDEKFSIAVIKRQMLSYLNQ